MKTYLLKAGVRQAIAKAGETDVAVAYNAKTWIDEYPAGNPQLMVTTPGGKRVPVTVEAVDNLITGQVPNELLAGPGVYSYVFVWTSGSTQLESGRCECLVLGSNLAKGLVHDSRKTPDWAERIFLAAEVIEGAVNGAMEARNVAADMAAEAAESEANAAGSAEDAEDSATLADQKATAAAASAEDAAASAAAMHPENYVAQDFSASSAYRSGTYVMHDGHLYRLTADHDADVTWENTAKAQVKVADDVGDFKSAFEPITGNRPIEMVKNAQITNTDATLNLNGITSRAGRNCAIVPCQAGDVFTLNGTSGTTLRLFAFFDGSTPPAVINGYIASAGYTGDNTVVVAPKNAAYMAINDVSGAATSYYGELLTAREQAYKAGIKSITGNSIIEMRKNTTINNSGNTLDLDGFEFRLGFNSAIIECNANDKFTINGTSGTTLRLWAFFDANKNAISGSVAPASVTGNNTVITAPSTAKYLAINDISGVAVSYYGELLLPKVSTMQTDLTTAESNITDIMGDVSELESKTDKNTDNISNGYNLLGLTEITDWTLGHGYKYSNGVVDATPVATSIYDCFEIACNPGNVFTLSCNSATAAKAYYFIDANRNILTIGVNQNYNNKIFVAPPGTTHLVVNKYKTNTNKCYKGAFIPTNYPTDLNINKNLVGNENIMWVGWCYPSVQSFERVRNKLYFGYTTGDGFTGIGEYDFDTERFTKTHLKKGQIDNHNASAVHVFSDGTIVCGYASGHNYDNSMHVRISTQPECIETFGDDISLECSGVTSYCQFIEYNSILYMFYRIDDIRWVYRQSTDKGKTWSEETTVLQSITGLKYYCLFTPTTTSGIVRMTMYSNPTASATGYPDGDSRIRMGFLNLSTGKIYNSDGSTEVQDITWTSFNILIDNETNMLNRLRDVAVSDVSRPMILYTVFRGTTDGIYKLYDAGNTVTIASAGAEFLSTTQLGTSWIGTDKIVVIRGIVDNGVSKDSVEIWSYTNGTVAQQETVYQEERGSIPIRNMVPIVDVNGKAFLWARGFHKSSGTDRFTNFNTDAKIHVLS